MDLDLDLFRRSQRQRSLLDIDIPHYHYTPAQRQKTKNRDKFLSVAQTARATQPQHSKSKTMRFTSAITIITLLSATPIAADDSSTSLGAPGSGSGRQRRLSSKVVKEGTREERNLQNIFRNSNVAEGEGRDADWVAR